LDGHKANNCPDNLEWGTPKENADDRDRHGTTARGERNGGGGKLTNDAVARIKRQLLEGATQKAIAREFGVSQGMIWFIKSGRQWAHIEAA
jgi:hypothetical protein